VTPSDRIRLTGLRASAFHGVLDFERANGQLFLIDLTLHLSLAPAAASDDVADTVHYGELAEAVVKAVESDPVNLIETVAERVATVVLAYPLVDTVDVVVHKPNAPISVPFDDVTVEITRSRG
jgi:7,8-dihydroneopterin aldolase/epimerase/oxygenase